MSIKPLIGSMTLLFVLASTFVAARPQEPVGTPVSTEGSTAPPETADSEEAEAEGPPRADLSEANALLKAQDYAAAEELLGELAVEFPEDPALLLMYGEVLLMLGDPGEAKEVLEKSASIDPKRPRVHFQLAAAQASLGDPREAIKAFGIELENNDDPAITPLIRLNRSLLLQQLGRWNEAAPELEAYLELKPEETGAFGDLVTVYVQAGKPQQADATLKRGEELGFVSATHFYSVGALFYRDERYSDAERLLRRAVEVNPELADAQRSLAATLEKMGRTKEAHPHLRRYLELRPDASDRAQIEARLAGS